MITMKEPDEGKVPSIDSQNTPDIKHISPDRRYPSWLTFSIAGIKYFSLQAERTGCYPALLRIPHESPEGLTEF